MSELDEVTQLRALASMQGQRIAELEAQNEMLIDKAHLEVRTTYDSIVVQAWREKLEAVERHNALLRPVAEDCVTLLKQIIGWRIGIMGEFGEVYSGSISRKRIGEMYLKAVAIDGGALGEGE